MKRLGFAFPLVWARIVVGAAVCLLPAAAHAAPPKPTPSPVLAPKPLTEVERQAARVVSDFLARGPEAFWDALSKRAPFRTVGHDEAMKEIEIRVGKKEDAHWELRTRGNSVSASSAIFTVEYPSGLDQVIVLDFVEEGEDNWKLHRLRTLAEPSTSTLWNEILARKKSRPVAEKLVPLTTAALVATAIFLPLAFLLRRRLAVSLVLTVLGFAAGGLCAFGILRVRAIASKRDARATVQGFPRLAALLPFRDRIETTESKTDAEALLSSLPDEPGALDLASVWLAQKAMQRMALDEAEELLSRFPSGRVHWAEVLRARLAFLKNKPTDVAVAYDNAVALGPAHDGLVMEACDVTTMLGSESGSATFLADLAVMGTRSSDAYYRMTERALELDHEDEAEKAFLVGWGLKPIDRRELFALEGGWSILKRASILPTLHLDWPDEPTATTTKSASMSIPLPPSAQAHICGRAFRVEVGDASLEVPGGAELAAAGTPLEGAGAQNRAQEARALARFDTLSKTASSVGAFSQPLLRRQIRRTAVALARRNRWRDVAVLTAGLNGTDEQVPPDIVLLRAEALRRTNRADMAKRLLLELAKNPTFERRNMPSVIYRLGEMFASFEEFDLAATLIEKGSRSHQKEFARERIRQLKTEQRLAKSYSVYASPHFEIHYPPDTNKQTAIEAARILELERERIQQYIPSDTVRVVTVQLLWFEEFRSTFAGGSDHLVGLYDGKIRVPLAGVITWVPVLVSIMTHELAHALIAQATDDRAPHWFQEGLAQKLEMRHFRPNHVGYYREKGMALSIPALEEVLRGFADYELVEEAYQEADWMIQFIELKYGAAAIPKMLKGFRDGLSSEEVIQQALGVSMATFNEAFFGWSVTSAPKMLIKPVVSYLEFDDDVKIGRRGKPAPVSTDPDAEPTPKPKIPQSLKKSTIRYN